MSRSSWQGRFKVSPFAFKTLWDDDYPTGIINKTLRRLSTILSMTPIKRSFLLDDDELKPTYRFCREHVVPIDASIYDDRATCPVGHQVKSWWVVQGEMVLASSSDKRTTWLEQPKPLSYYALQVKEHEPSLDLQKLRLACVQQGEDDP